MIAPYKKSMREMLTGMDRLRKAYESSIKINRHLKDKVRVVKLEFWIEQIILILVFQDQKHSNCSG